MSRITIFLITIVCLLLFLIILCFAGLKDKKREQDKTEQKKNDLVKNNEFIFEKREKHEKIMDSNAASLNSERQFTRKRMILYGILVFGAIALYFIFKKTILIPLISLLLLFHILYGGMMKYLFFKV